jgi:HemY protein
MRAIVALILVAAAGAGAAFFADHPGRVEIVWQGWQVETSFGVLALAVALLVLSVTGLALLGGALRRWPGNFRRRRAARRRRAGEAALTGGLVALAAGHPAQAQRAARRAAALLAEPGLAGAPLVGSPIALLLAAEAATRLGDRAEARRAYTALLERRDSEFLGLGGLIGQALRTGEDAAALHLAERAQRLRPDARWLVEALIVLAARAGDWRKVRDTLAGATQQKLLPAALARHHRGVVLHELSREAERSGDLRRAAGLAAKAQALAADLAAPAAHHARLLIGLGRKRAAAKAIERAWRNAPDPGLARLYLDIDPEAGALARASAMQLLASHNPEAQESRLAIAEAALAAQLWGEARHHLGLALAATPPQSSPSQSSPPGSSPPEPSRPGPSRRLCLLMARLEDSEAGNASAARLWLDRAIGAPPDPSYVCTRCGGETAEWLALCRECGGFDTLSWRSPPSRPRPFIAPPASAAALPMLPAPEVPGDMPAEGGARRAPARSLPGLPRSLPWFRASGLARPARWDK